MTGILLTQSQTPIIGQIAWALGMLMDWIFNLLSKIGINNIGITIIVFTIVVYTLMLPLTVRQQKSMKLNAVIMPEIQQIQKKYKNKKDQASMLKQQEEIKMVYDKYGTSQLGGCSQMLIQMPLLFGFFAVIRNVPAYVTQIKEAYMPLVNGIMSTTGYQAIMESIGANPPIAVNPDKFAYTSADTIVDVLYKFQDSTWSTLYEKFPSLTSLITETEERLRPLNSFLGINIAETPWTLLTASLASGAFLLVILALMIPLLSGITQYISIKLQPQAAAANTGGDENAMMNSMNSMTKIMPMFSVVMCFTMPAGLGLYWIISAVVRTVQQVAINWYFKRQSLDDMIEKNKEKAAKKREKRGTSSSKLNEMAQRNVRSIAEPQKSVLSEAEKKKKMETAAELNQNAKAGSLAARANLAKKYNESDAK